MLKEGVNILEYFSMNVCRMCVCYKTNKCCPKIKRLWKDSVTEVQQESADYSIECFTVTVANDTGDNENE